MYVLLIFSEESSQFSGIAASKKTVGPFATVQSAFDYLTEKYTLANDNMIACLHYDFELVPQGEVLTWNAKYARITPLTNAFDDPHEDPLVKRLDAMITAVTALADYADETKQHASAIRVGDTEGRTFTTTEVANMLASLTTKLEPVREYVNALFAEIKKEVGK